jgi:glyoxylase-like metal-dependent hydrolase (beta-lactamase superfamily II)
MLTISLTFGALCTFAQKPVPVPQEAKSFKLGALQISVLRDSALNIPNDGSIFGANTNPPAIAKVLHDAGAPTDEIRLDTDTLLIRMPGHFVLIDAGYGQAEHGVMRESLASIGVSPGEITDILITHAHPDHVGGLVDAQGRSAFPKAAIRMSAKEWASMQSQAYLHAQASAIKAQVQTFEPGRPVLPGITPLALPGHTPGEVGYEIASQGQRLVDIGDIAHSSIISLAKPEWTIKWDSDLEEGVKTRREELQRLATTHELVFVPHFPSPGVRRIERKGEGFSFLPELPSNK